MASRPLSATSSRGGIRKFSLPKQVHQSDATDLPASASSNGIGSAGKEKEYFMSMSKLDLLDALLAAKRSIRDFDAERNSLRANTARCSS